MFTDDFTGFKIGYLIKCKSEALTCFKTTRHMQRNIMESQYASYVLMGEASIPPMSAGISSSKKASKLNEPRRIHHSQMERANERTER